jgi:hypothetical protein
MTSPLAPGQPEGDIVPFQIVDFEKQKVHYFKTKEEIEEWLQGLTEEEYERITKDNNDDVMTLKDEKRVILIRPEDLEGKSLL